MEVQFDSEKRLPYHTTRFGERVYHECPEGFKYNDEGETVPKLAAAKVKPVGRSTRGSGGADKTPEPGADD